MLYFGTTDIPGLYNVCDAGGCVLATDLSRGQLDDFARQRCEELQFIPPPEPGFELQPGVWLRTADFVARHPPAFEDSIATQRLVLKTEWHPVLTGNGIQEMEATTRLVPTDD